jgi:uncharacterized protein (DUF849 family)
VPLTPAELAAEGAAAVAAGAAALHVHPRDDRGAESLDGAVNAAAVAAVRAACPGVPVGVTTGLWIAGEDPERRAALVAGWTDPLPDFASVNLGEAGAAALMRQLLDQGVGVEAGLADLDDVDALAATGLADRCVRALLEPSGDGGTATALAAAMEERLAAHGIATPTLHHGEDAATWDVIRAALALGRDVRVGLEDVLVLPDGTAAAGNAELVAATSARRA